MASSQSKNKKLKLHIKIVQYQGAIELLSNSNFTVQACKGKKMLSDGLDWASYLAGSSKHSKNIPCRSVINGKAGKTAALPKFLDTLALSQTRRED